jgi:hypothetical protein
MSVGISKIKIGDMVTLKPMKVTWVDPEGDDNIKIGLDDEPIWISSDMIASHTPAPRDLRAGDKVRINIKGGDHYIYEVIFVHAGKAWVGKPDCDGVWPVESLERAEEPAPIPQTATAPLQLREGGYYKARNGRKVGPLKPYDGDLYRWKGAFLYYDNGQIFGNVERDEDIVAEWTAADDGFVPGARVKIKNITNSFWIESVEGQTARLCGIYPRMYGEWPLSDLALVWDRDGRDE